MFVIVFIGGVLAWNNTSKEEMPDIEFDHTHVTARYPGATAEEVEHFVTKPLEDQVNEIAEEKIRLAQSILKDETENYSFGKVSLNDYIYAVNMLDRDRYNKILRDVRYRNLMIEWLRLTDSLVTRDAGSALELRLNGGFSVSP